MSMKESSKMLLAAVLFFGLATLATIFGGCGGGDDDTTCMAVENCPDAGMMTADADPTAPDADTTPDANSDVCADYYWMAEKPWNCQTGIPTICDIELLPVDGVCGIQCHDVFWLPPDQLTIFKDPPTRLIFYIDGEPITCYQNL